MTTKRAVAKQTVPSSADPIPLVPDGAISLNQFFPFVLADPMAKRSEVRSLQRIHGMYTPAVDYWRLLRLQVVAHHRYEPGLGMNALDSALELAHPERKELYGEAVAGYRRFLGRKQVKWIDTPRRGMWVADALQVRVQPELHVSINGEPHVVKLYLRTGANRGLNQRKANSMAYLIGVTHGHLGRPLVVDVLRGKAFGLTRQGFDYESMLRSQAAAFLSLWRAGALVGQSPSSMAA